MDFFKEKVAPFLREDANVDLLRAEFEKAVSTLAMEQVPGVIKNKEEILNEKKALQAELSELKEKFSPFEENEVTFETYNQIKSEYDALKATGGEGTLDKEREAEIYNRGKKSQEEALTPMIKKLQEENQKYQESLKNVNSKYVDFRARNEILKSLEEMGIEYNDFWLEGLLRKSEINYNDQEDKVEISVAYDGGMIPLSDWKNVYPESEAGKKMRRAPINTGGGAHGGRGGKGGALSLEQIERIPDRGERIAALESAGYLT